MGSSLGTSKQSTNASQTQSGTIAPWDKATPQIEGILSGISNEIPNTQLSDQQYQAINTLKNNSASMPNYGNQAQNIAEGLMTGGADYRPMVADAYSKYQGALTPYAQGNYLDPMNAPGMASVLDTIRSDVTGSINGMFAGAGRDLSGANQGAIARGLSQGLAAPLLNQYNQNVDRQFQAANGILGGAQSAAGAQSGLQQSIFGNQLSGLNTAMTSVPSARNAGAMQMLEAEAMRRGIPVQALAQLAGLTVPIAGLGKQYTGDTQSESSTRSTASPLTQISQGVGIIGSLFSDPKLKEDIREVGRLYDGQKVYAYRYKGNPTTHVGLMADEVERVMPEAVGRFAGFMTVDYAKATSLAAEKARR